MFYQKTVKKIPYCVIQIYAIWNYQKIPCSGYFLGKMKTFLNF